MIQKTPRNITGYIGTAASLSGFCPPSRRRNACVRSAVAQPASHCVPRARPALFASSLISSAAAAVSSALALLGRGEAGRALASGPGCLVARLVMLYDAMAPASLSRGVEARAALTGCEEEAGRCSGARFACARYVLHLLCSLSSADCFLFLLLEIFFSFLFRPLLFSVLPLQRTSPSVSARRAFRSNSPHPPCCARDLPPADSAS
ncbi:uncharacterized protein K452DRAFT_158987 [Aplosporella prunicola CBS 121167]|uniref:Uncharacterized protein n=1 Tax=Aplosporella prunicola CBS 121167 TaxID=1176127 RepID=A0A6A6AUU7_9PEZI|nr:uncharacterized protein K452DRAFT_158987 [Aplosporella prunicola CBS 121167]KAF2135802.1 hypothetical protein K452DRAFT_158987 [Aplosporella prunicola CBS 121167]